MIRFIAFAVSAASAVCVVAAVPALADTIVTPSAPAGATLEVDVEGVRGANGQIRAELLRADRSAGVARPAGAVVVPSAAGMVRLRFEGLTPGDYAVRIFHDENGDGEMQTNVFGIPTEGYGFSNRARAGFGPPKFEEMKVQVDTGAVRTAAVLAY